MDDRSRTHACERPHPQRAVPLISGHQRPAAAGDFRPPDHLRTGARHPCPQQLAQPRTTRDHQQGNGDSYDNALAEALSSLYKAELIRNQGPWEDIDAVEVATAEWVHWYGHHPATLRRRHAYPRRARSRLGPRRQPEQPETITIGNHRHQVNQPPQNPRLDTLAAHRKRHHLTQTDVAHALNTYPARISDIENHRRPLLQLTHRYHQYLTTLDTQ